jgi:hypothetical protein
MSVSEKPEKTIKLLNSPAPLLVIDFNVMCFAVLTWYESKISGMLSKEVERKLVRGAWALFVNRGPQYMPRHNYRIVFAADFRNKKTGNYWRNEYMEVSDKVKEAWINHAEKTGVELSSLKTNYKGTRSDKTENFWFVYNEGLEYCNKYFPWFWHEGFEADDVASCICRLSRNSKPGDVIKDRQILLHTVDKDWIQLVDDENQIYFSDSRFVRANEKIQNQLHNESTVREWVTHKMKATIEHPREIAAHKARLSDMCDNLPAGSPEELFDLVEPISHPQWNLDNFLLNDYFIDNVNKPEGNTRADHFEQSLKAFTKICLDIPVKL